MVNKLVITYLSLTIAICEVKQGSIMYNYNFLTTEIIFFIIEMLKTNYEATEIILIYEALQVGDCRNHYYY